MTAFQTIDSKTLYDGPIFSVHQQQVRLPDAEVVTRDVVTHLDAVAVVALDDSRNVALVKQYRHPLGSHLYELPAGLMDESTESPAQTALRELQEETGVVAGKMAPLFTIASSPGFTDERVRIFLATDLSYVGRPKHAQGEEKFMTTLWLSLDNAVNLVFQGEIISAHTVAGILGAKEHLS